MLLHCYCSADESSLDNKYLQRSDEIPLREAPRSLTPTHTSLHFSGPQPSAPAPGNPTRLSKDVILAQKPLSAPHAMTKPDQMVLNNARAMNSGDAGVRSSHPPLASAYFPTHNKVT